MGGLEKSPILVNAHEMPNWCATCTHASALNMLATAVQYRKGYACVFGERGSGKSTLFRAYAEQAWRGGVRAIVVDGRCKSYADLVRSILVGLRVNADGKDARWLRRRLQLAAQLHLASGRLLAVLVDDADKLGDAVLSQLHLLIDTSAGQESVLQVVLAGTRVLEKRLQSTLLAPVNQRISARATLSPIEPEERVPFIQTVVAREPYPTGTVLPPRALRRIVRKSRGNPGRLIDLTREALHALPRESGTRLFATGPESPAISGARNR
jgi:type II secretory pathway predicted ATPase ExeA